MYYFCSIKRYVQLEKTIIYVWGRQIQMPHDQGTNGFKSSNKNNKNNKSNEYNDWNRQHNHYICVCLVPPVPPESPQVTAAIYIKSSGQPIESLFMTLRMRRTSIVSNGIGADLRTEATDKTSKRKIPCFRKPDYENKHVSENQNWHLMMLLKTRNAKNFSFGKSKQLYHKGSENDNWLVRKAPMQQNNGSDKTI